MVRIFFHPFGGGLFISTLFYLAWLLFTGFLLLASLFVGLLQYGVPAISLADLGLPLFSPLEAVLYRIALLGLAWVQAALPLSCLWSLSRDLRQDTPESVLANSYEHLLASVLSALVFFNTGLSQWLYQVFPLTPFSPGTARMGVASAIGLASLGFAVWARSSGEHHKYDQRDRTRFAALAIAPLLAGLSVGSTFNGEAFQWLLKHAVLTAAAIGFLVYVPQCLLNSEDYQRTETRFYSPRFLILYAAIIIATGGSWYTGTLIPGSLLMLAVTLFLTGILVLNTELSEEKARDLRRLLLGVEDGSKSDLSDYKHLVD